MTACKKPLSGPDETSTEIALDMEQAMKDLDKYCSGGAANIRFDNYVYDFTGDDGLLTVEKYAGNYVVTGTVELIDNELVFS